MFISYLDSSGRPILTDLENYVLASITINEHSWYPIKKKIEIIKSRHFPHIPIDEIEFHAKDMMNQDGIYKHLSWEKIYSILDDIFNIISEEDTHLVIISTIIQKSKLRKDIDIEKWGHRLLFERLNLYLESQNENLIKAGHYHEYGIMIIDTEGHKKDQKLRDKLSDMLMEGTFYSKLDYLIEDPLFTDSKWRNLSQIVDCITYCIRKKYRQNTKSIHTTNWNKYYDMIEKKFHQINGNYLGYGLKIFPENFVS